MASRRWQAQVAEAAVLIMVVILAGALRWTTPEAVADLRPWPDALEYEEGARSLIAGQGYTLTIDGKTYPPRYPPGFSLLIVPALVATGGEPGSGIWSVFVAALVAVVMAWALGRMGGGALGGIVAALLLAVAPLHVRWSKAVMADVPCSAMLAALAVWGLSALRRDARSAEWFALGIGCGLAALLRSMNVCVLVPLVALVVVRRSFVCLAALIVGAGAGLVPTFLLGILHFGSPLGNGYQYWVPAQYFAWQFVLHPPASGGTEGNLTFYLNLLAGAGSLYPRSIAGLVVVGAVIAARYPGPPRALATLAVMVTLAFVATFAPFFWQWDRFLLPLLPCLCALAAAAIGPLAAPTVRIVAVLLLAVGLLAIHQDERGYDAPDRNLRIVESLRAMDVQLEPDATIISAAPYLLAQRFLHRGDRRWMPIGPDPHRQAIHRWHLRPLGRRGDDGEWVVPGGSPFRPRLFTQTIEGLLRAGRPVYLSTQLSFQVPDMRRVWAALSRFDVEPSGHTARYQLYRIKLRASAIP